MLLARQPRAGPTAFSPAMFNLAVWAPWLPTEVTRVPPSCATDAINSSRAEGVGHAQEQPPGWWSTRPSSSCSIWGTNDTRGRTCRGMPSACLLAELMRPGPNWTAMQKCPSFLVQFCSSVLHFTRRLKPMSVPRLPLGSPKIQKSQAPCNGGHFNRSLDPLPTRSPAQPWPSSPWRFLFGSPTQHVSLGNRYAMLKAINPGVQKHNLFLLP